MSHNYDKKAQLKNGQNENRAHKIFAKKIKRKKIENSIVLMNRR